MHPTTEQLLATLEVLLEEKLICRLPSNKTSSWLPFVWNSSQKVEFNAINLLRSEGWIQPTDIEVAIRNWQEIEERGTPTEDDYRAEERFDEEEYQQRNGREFKARKEIYRQLVGFLQAKLKEIRVVKLSCWWEYSCFTILGKTDSGDWICVASTVPLETPEFSDILVTYDDAESTPIATLHKSTVALKEQLDEILKSLTPVTIYGHYDGGYGNTYEHKIICEAAPTEDKALQEALFSSGLLGISQFKTFYPDAGEYIFTGYSTREEGTKLYERYQRLNGFFTNNFPKLLMYEFSFWDRKQIFVVGQSADNDWVGVRLTSLFYYNP